MTPEFVGKVTKKKKVLKKKKQEEIDEFQIIPTQIPSPFEEVMIQEEEKEIDRTKTKESEILSMHESIF